MAKQQRAIETREKLLDAAGRVFATRHFETARVADILEESTVTQGAFYFHFPGGKKQIAEVLIERQDGQFAKLCEHVSSSGIDGLSGLLELADRLGRVLQTEHIAQAGIRLVVQASSSFPGVAHLPSPAWLEAISAFLYRAEGEGNLRKGVDIPLAAKSVVYLFTGAQVSSFVNDEWGDLNVALRAIEPYVTQALATEGFSRTRLVD